jgi:hypothetical protein
MSWYNEQLIRMGDGQFPDPGMNFFTAFLRANNREKQMALQVAKTQRELGKPR